MIPVHGIVRRRAPGLAALAAALLLAAPAARAADPDSTAAAAPKPAAGTPASKPAAATPAPAAKPTPAAKPAKAPKPPRARKPRPSREELVKADGTWAQGTNWLTLRAGYAKRTGDAVGQGLVGYGVAWRRMLTNRWALDAGIDHDVVGHFDTRIDEAVPFTVGLTRHFKWNTSLRPYAGAGGGYYFRKFYRTGSEDNTTTTSGFYVAFGANAPLDDRHLLGVEARVHVLRAHEGVTNPVFGVAKSDEVMWTLKASWALAY